MLRPQKIFWLLLAFIALGAVYAFVTPLFEISDELWHYPMVKTLADGNGLPVQDPAHPGAWRQEGSQPPLYYMAMALATRWIDTSDMEQVRWLNPHADNGIITQDRNNNILIHRPSEMVRLTGTALAVRIIRLLSVLMGAGTVYFTYRLALELMPEQEWLALASAAFVAFIPMFLFISASVNNDNLAILCSSATLWLLARWLKHPPQKISWMHVWLGVLLGCGALSKQSALGLWGLAGLVLIASRAIENWRSRDWRIGIWSLVFGILLVFGIAALISFWWYLRNYQLYGDWLGWNTFIAIVGERPRPASLAILWGERVGFMQAFWGLFGGVSVAMPDWVYTVLNTMLAFAGVGLIAGTVSAVRARHSDNGLKPIVSAAQWALPVGWLVLIFIGLIRWTSLTWASQGRLIFPALSAIAVLAITGLTRLSLFAFRSSPLAFRSSLLVIFHSSFVILLSATVPFTVLAPHYTSPPALTPAQLAAIPHRLDANFGGEMTLLGYQLDTPSVAPGDPVRLTLYWQSQIPMDRNWSTFVHVVDSDGIIIAQRDRYPGQGALATTLLAPGQTFADEYVIPLPAETYAPTPAHIEVGLYDLLDGARLAVTNAADAVTLTESLAVTARAESGVIPNIIHQNFGNQIELLGYELQPRAMHPGETVHLTLYWRALRDISINYAVFAHVRGEGETLWAGQDAWPQNGAAPTAAWRKGDVIKDEYTLTLKPDTPPGQWFVEVGLYAADSLERLQLVTSDGRWTDADYLDVSKIRVEP